MEETAHSQKEQYWQQIHETQEKSIEKVRRYLTHKRVFDVILSAVFLVILFIPMIIIGAVVKADSAGPALFTQERLGLNGKPFVMYKFRSMKINAEKRGPQWSAREDPRCTRVGRFLRKTRLDELPQLINILKGDMSIVGPRPLLVKYLDHYNAHDARRHEVRPGLTGLAQVSGRNALSWKDKFEKDIEYVDNLTFIMDVKVILLTIKKVFVREGIEFKEGHQPIMDYFQENSKESSK